MKFRGYDVNFDEAGVIIDGIRDFDPNHTFECGQCFRWHREADGSYTGVVRGRVANAVYTPGKLVLNNVFPEDFEQVWFDYFDLGRNYTEIKKAVAIDDVMRKAVEFGGGIRLLRQEPWETLISFILSSNNRIPRIMKIIEDISRLYGSELKYRGRKYHAFPEVQSLAACSLEQIEVCRAGYRCGYIQQTAADVAVGAFDLQQLAGLDTADARNYLLQLHGVGCKVADCMLLYSGMKQDVFPTDVWVRRVMEELYFKREVSFKEVQQFAAEHFGEYAGIAQQYLFYYAREQKIGVK
jgi:N-glycosylase/DNA lyase